jgi:hypothetical protein
MRNVGSIDRMVRVVLGLALLSLWFVLSGPVRYVALVGLVPLLTAAIGFCPLYTLIGLKTNRTKRGVVQASAAAGISGPVS